MGPLDIHPSVFVESTARIIGEVSIGKNSSVWFNAVIRGDEGPVKIGDNSNIQDCCVLHSDLGLGIDIGNWVTIGHGTVIRSAKIGHHTMVGMNCTLMSGVVVPEHCIIGAHSFVPYNTHFSPRSMIYGSPAKFIRELNENELSSSRIACKVYLDLVEQYRSGNIKSYENSRVVDYGKEA
jgi:carbonic anhydrase/acetyltransferase-like protein (isoleucine patch superfamily)